MTFLMSAVFSSELMILKSKSLVQQTTLYKLLQESKNGSDSEKVSFNFSKYVLSDIEKKLLAKSLKKFFMIFPHIAFE